MSKKNRKGEQSALAEYLYCIDTYLAKGHGRGRLNSAAAVYNGRPGYFFVCSITVTGVEQDAIFFSHVDGSDDALITAIPAVPKQ